MRPNIRCRPIRRKSSPGEGGQELVLQLVVLGDSVRCHHRDTGGDLCARLHRVGNRVWHACSSGGGCACDFSAGKEDLSAGGSGWEPVYEGGSSVPCGG